MCIEMSTYIGDVGVVTRWIAVFDIAPVTAIDECARLVVRLSSQSHSNVLVGPQTVDGPTVGRAGRWLGVPELDKAA